MNFKGIPYFDSILPNFQQKWGCSCPGYNTPVMHKQQLSASCVENHFMIFFLLKDSLFVTFAQSFDKKAQSLEETALYHPVWK